jgi:glycosyltransferase involved in cell wall biosynthesis
MNADVPLVSIVIPCFNEQENIPKLIAACKGVSAMHPIEFILVNNGSTDSTGEAIDFYIKGVSRIRSLTIEINLGYGFGILSGLGACEGKYIGWTHADLQTDINDLLAIIPILSDLKDTDKIFIKGKRLGRPLTDSFFTLGMSIFESIIFKKRLWDINAQPTIFSRSLSESFIEPPKDLSLDLYAYLMATSNNYQIERVPVRFYPRVHGTSSWNTDWKSKKKFIQRTMSFTFALRRKLNANN